MLSCFVRYEFPDCPFSTCCSDSVFQPTHSIARTLPKFPAMVIIEAGGRSVCNSTEGKKGFMNDIPAKHAP